MGTTAPQKVEHIIEDCRYEEKGKLLSEAMGEIFLLRDLATKPGAKIINWWQRWHGVK